MTEETTFNDLLTNKTLRRFNIQYKDFLKHFSKLYGQMRFFGKHAAGVAITSDDIDNYVAVMKVNGNFQTSYDLDSLGKIHVVKVDILGLKTMSVIKELERLTSVRFKYKMLDDDKLYEQFCNANTDGIFQFEKEGAKDVLRRVQPDNIQDLIACNALNRPAPIQLGVLDKFVAGKQGDIDKSVPWYTYTKDTYGTIVYQEHVMQICKEFANLSWDDTDKIMKNLSPDRNNDPQRPKFVKGAVKYGGITKSQAEDLYDQMTLYLFNKGHGAGYTLISLYMMYFKVYHPLEFYYAILKYEDIDIKLDKHKCSAVADGQIIMLPHVNGTSRFSIKKVDGEKVIQEGLSSIKGVGLKTAELIEQLGPYDNYAHFIAKVPKSKVNKRIMDALENAGALTFDEEKYLKRVTKYNTSLYSRASKK
jgi:DNA polymerase-3 subunit alpha